MLLLALAALSLGGVVLILYSTRWGPWAFSDSVEFFASARNLLAGRGLGLYSPSGRFMPLQLHPPLYPLILAGLAKAGPGLITAARWFNAILFGATVFLVGLAAFGVSRSLPLSVVFGAAVLATVNLVNLYSGAMTEPLFFWLVMGSMCLLLLAAQQHTGAWLALSGVLVGLGIVTRYAGVAVLGAGLVFIVIYRRQFHRSWVLSVGVFAILSLLPLAVWMSRQPTAGEPPIGLQVPEIAQAWGNLAPVRAEVARHVWGWLPFTGLLPELSHRGRLAAILAVLVLSFGLFVATIVRRRKLGLDGGTPSIAFRAIILLLLFVVCYIGLLAFTIVSRDVRLDLIERTLLPISLALSCAAFCLAWYVGEAWVGKRWTTVGLAVVGIWIIAMGILPTYERVSILHAEGRGYTSAAWRDSGVVKGLNELDAGLTVVTNEPAAVELWTGRSAYDLLRLEAERPATDGEECCADGMSLLSTLPGEAGALAMFDSIYGQWLTVDEATTRAKVEALTEGMTVYSDYWDGTIFLYQLE